MIDGKLRVGDRIRPKRSRTGRIWRVRTCDTRPDGRTVWLYLVPVGDETNGGGGTPGRQGTTGGVRALRRLQSELDGWERVA